MPATVAYGNPAYLAGYGAAPVTAYRPTVAAAGYYQPAVAYYAPATAAYAPSYSYAISPAGGSSAGSEAMASFAQPVNVNYLPPRVAYRTVVAAVPTYTYRPVVAYDPVVAQPTTCLQPAVTSTCQAQRQRCGSCFSWLNPFNWFRHGCGGCGSPAPTVAYCQPSSCGQPYYPAPAAVIPTVPAPTTAPIITTPAPSIPAAGPRVPSPPTRTPAFGTAPA